MIYQETLDYLFNRLPMYQRIGEAAYKVDLNNTIKLCEILQNPHLKFKSIHVAGTNGKGSTSHMLASVLQESGYKVGLYTSPHLKDFRERIRVNGEMISKDEVVDFVSEYKRQFEQINLSFFEWTVGLAFNHFVKARVDIAIIETGLGGRLDSTNIITPEISVITNIGLDHTQFLGNTLPKIAAEKAGIIKPNVPVVVGETQEETKQIFIDKAKEMNTSIAFADNNVKTLYKTDLKGSYQKKNIKTALLTLDELKQIGWNIGGKDVEKGLLNVVKNTGLLGRWQVLSKSPLVICDTGHNVSGIREVVGQLEKTNYNHLHFVFGAVNDKSIENVLDLLPSTATYYLCQANIPRALVLNELIATFEKKKLSFVKCLSVRDALTKAQQSASNDDLVFVGGSTFVVAEVL